VKGSSTFKVQGSPDKGFPGQATLNTEHRTVFNMNEYTIETPDYAGATLPDGLELKGHKLFLSPPGCCAQTTLPFRAKIIGKIKNFMNREIFTNVTVQLMNADNAIMDSYSEVMILEAGQTGEFDIKLVEYNKNIKKYSLKFQEIEELEFGA